MCYRFRCSRRGRVIGKRRRLLLSRLRCRRASRTGGWSWRARERVRRGRTLSSRREVCAYSCLLQLLHYRAHGISVLCRLLKCWWRISDVELVCWQHRFQMAKKCCCVFFGPEVNVERVNFVQELLLVTLIVCRQMPLIVALDRLRGEHDGAQCRLLIRVSDMVHGTQVSRERILLRCSSVVCHFQLSTTLCRIVVDVRIAAL